MVGRIVSLTYEDGRIFAEGGEHLAQRVQSAESREGLAAVYWMYDRWNSKLVAVSIYETEEALRASEEALTQALEELARRFPPVEQTVEEFVVAAKVER